ncbi:DUF1127 domain-containing protein, partial [Bradyrhizobium sp.]|uniref:DUF1127 domain-containing protein n=1 Tax=Bradyrhizobium sp. TaxID=376 RepID=UPI003C595BBB
RSPHLIERQPPRARLAGRDQALTRTGSSGETTPWRVVSTAGSGLLLKASSGFAGSGEVVFPNVLFAIVSWIVKEILQGCAAYAEAMYPGMAPLDEIGGDADRQAERGPLQELPTRAPRATPSLAVVARNEKSGDGPVVSRGRTQRSDAGCVARDNQVRPRPPDVARSGWRPRIALVLTVRLLRLRRAIQQRQAIRELRNLDDRALRDIGISRCDIEHLARSGDSRE